MAARWKQHEVAYLFDHATDGAEAIAEALGRTVRSVEVQASRYGVSLRPRWLCPRCGRSVFTPLSMRTGWCKACSINESKDSAAIANRKARFELREERSRIRKAEQERQALYSDTNKRRTKLRRFREVREVNEKQEGATCPFNEKGRSTPQ